MKKIPETFFALIHEIRAVEKERYLSSPNGPFVAKKIRVNAAGGFAINRLDRADRAKHNVSNKCPSLLPEIIIDNGMAHDEYELIF